MASLTFTSPRDSSGAPAAAELEHVPPAARHDVHVERGHRGVDNPMTNLSDALTPIRPIAEVIGAACNSVGLVRLVAPTTSTDTNRGALFQTCALVRFDRNSTSERIYCLLSRTPDMNSWTSTEPGVRPTIEQQATGLGPPPGPARPPTSETSGISLARNPDVAHDQGPRSSDDEALATLLPEHQSSANVLASDPILALLAEARFEFACGAHFEGLEVKFPWRHREGGVLLELASACVTSLEHMGLSFLPLWYAHTHAHTHTHTHKRSHTQYIGISNPLGLESPGTWLLKGAGFQEL